MLCWFCHDNAPAPGLDVCAGCDSELSGIPQLKAELERVAHMPPDWKDRVEAAEPYKTRLLRQLADLEASR